MPPKAKQCSFREGRRRCPFPGTGDPPLCPAHRIALAEAARPKAPAEILAEAFDNFLSGRAVNVSATIGAADEIFSQWGMGGGMANGYHPPVDPGESEDSAHRRAQSGQRRGAPPWWWQQQGRRGAAPPPPDPMVEACRRARQIFGFAEMEVLTADVIKARHRVLVKKNHPDHGGSVAKMALINDARDVLMQSL